MLAFKDKKNTLFRKWNGPLTEDLLRRPGNFGLGQVPAATAPTATTTSICGFCATGCNLKVHLDANGNAINLSPEGKYPVNIGMACPKGWEALTPLTASDRATTPLLHNEQIDWPTALSTFRDRFKAIQKEYGKDSVAFISTGQIPFEEMAFLGAFAKFGMGVTHGDGNTRQCMATSVVAYKQSFGFDAPPYTYQDFEESDVLLFTGANPCIAHPIMWQRVMQNKRNPKIIVIDPRKTETAQVATRHVPLKPKGDLPLYYALAHCIIRDDRIDKTFIDQSVDGFEDFAAFVKDYTPESVTQSTGQSVENIESLAHTISEPGKRVSFWWTMGVNQSYEGVRTAQALINLALITGNIGKPGTGANSITGQCNAMGSRLFSNTTNLLGGHDFQDPDHRKKISHLLEIPEEKIPTENSWAYDQIIAGIDSGKIKGLWVIATNTAHSWINQNAFKELRKKLDFLVVQDMYHSTETAEIADLILPAAGWGEKSGCFINSERRIGTIKQIHKAPGLALSDFRIFQALAHVWGCGSLFKKWTDPEAVFQILKSVTKDQPCDITGITDYAHIDKIGGIQWPYLTKNSNSNKIEKQRRLFEDGKFYTPNQRAKLLFSPPSELPESASNDYPFTLLTGRGTSSQWHTQTRTGKSDILKKLYPKDLYIEIHPADAQDLNIRENELLEITSKRGKITARAYIAPTVQRGQVFLPMHYNMINQLTHPSFDPHSRQPNYKHCAINITKSR